jgi:hypothetical protein
LIFIAILNNTDWRRKKTYPIRKSTMTYTSNNRPEKCPACGCLKVAHIIYGEPDMSDVQLATELNNEKTILGGCEFDISNPSWQCLQCQTEIYRE